MDFLVFPLQRLTDGLVIVNWLLLNNVNNVDDDDDALDRNIQCDRKIASLQIKNQSKILIQFVHRIPQHYVSVSFHTRLIYSMAFGDSHFIATWEMDLWKVIRSGSQQKFIPKL